jgi:Holliday junction resolvase RusA-like endonuclease
MIKLSINTAPVSTNMAYKKRPYGHGLFMTEAGHSYKKQIWVAAIQKKHIHCHPEVTITFTYGNKRANDIDGAIKLTLDSMNNVMYLDDKDIVALHVFKAYAKDKPNVTITINEYEQS